MRALPTAVAISALVHGVAIAWVNTRPAEKPEPRAAVTQTPIEIVPKTAEVEPVLTEVTLLDDNTVVLPAPVPSSRDHTRRTGVASFRSNEPAPSRTGVASSPSRTGVASSESSEPRESPPPRSKLMTMRHPTIENGPSSEFWAKFEANTKPLQPKDIAGEQISSEIATAEGNLKNPRWIANATSEEVFAERAKLAQKRYEKSNAELQPDGEGTKADHHTFTAKFNPDGTVASIGDKRNLRAEKIPLKGEFDITDAMMRGKGMDPYASYKLKVLDETRDERVAIGKRYRTQQLAHSKQLVQRNLERLWASTSDIAARKRGVFELWDDCAETGSDELVAGGTSARAHVIGFIRSKFPAGSANAFTSEELARLNRARKSKATFAPYEM